MNIAVYVCNWNAKLVKMCQNAAKYLIITNYMEILCYICIRFLVL